MFQAQPCTANARRGIRRATSACAGYPAGAPRPGNTRPRAPPLAGSQRVTVPQHPAYAPAASTRSSRHVARRCEGSRCIRARIVAGWHTPLQAVPRSSLARLSSTLVTRSPRRQPWASIFSGWLLRASGFTPARRTRNTQPTRRFSSCQSLCNEPPVSLPQVVQRNTLAARELAARDRFDQALTLHSRSGWPRV